MNTPENPAPTSTRRGKIARLPAAIRRALNLRLENNEPADTILAWLNNLDETKRILAEQFHNAPVTPQNLSEWRHGGFRESQLLQELLDHATRLHEGVSDLSEQIDPPQLADDLAAALAARYAALLANWDGEITPEFEAKIKLLRGLTRDITALQKSFHVAAKQSRDLQRERKQDAAADLTTLKNQVIRRLHHDKNLSITSSFHPKTAPAIIAVEEASSPSEILDIWTHSQTQSDPIALDPTKITPTTTPAAA